MKKFIEEETIRYKDSKELAKADFKKRQDGYEIEIKLGEVDKAEMKKLEDNLLKIEMEKIKVKMDEEMKEMMQKNNETTEEW